jgi:hypothetical protein
MLYIEGHIQRVKQRYIKQRGLSQCHLGTVPDRQRTALKFRANFCCGCEKGRCGSSGGSGSAVAVAGFSARPGNRAEHRGCDDNDILPDAALSAAAALVSALELASAVAFASDSAFAPAAPFVSAVALISVSAFASSATNLSDTTLTSVSPLCNFNDTAVKGGNSCNA